MGHTGLISPYLYSIPIGLEITEKHWRLMVCPERTANISLPASSWNFPFFSLTSVGAKQTQAAPAYPMLDYQQSRYLEATKLGGLKISLPVAM